MLREAYIFKDKILYEKHFGKVLRDFNIRSFLSDIKNYYLLKLKDEFGSFEYFNYRISFIQEKDLSIIFIFVNELTDVLKNIKIELFKLRKAYLNFFSDLNNNNLDQSVLELLNPTLDAIHRSLKTKISLVGFSGVGKTSIKNLICRSEIPSLHIPTISGDISTVKIGKLYFHLLDFAGQENFSYLWNNFIRGSDTVFIITNSSLENVEKSKFFVELVKEYAPYARSTVIANKQDLPGALDVETIERITGLKAYAMIAIEQKNQIRMMNILADVLNLNAEEISSLQSLRERDHLIKDAELALKNEDFKQAIIIFDKIAKICFEIGDEPLGKEFYAKAEKINQFLKCKS